MKFWLRSCDLEMSHMQLVCHVVRIKISGSKTSRSLLPERKYYSHSPSTWWKGKLKVTFSFFFSFLYFNFFLPNTVAASRLSIKRLNMSETFSFQEELPPFKHCIYQVNCPQASTLVSRPASVSRALRDFSSVRFSSQQQQLLSLVGFRYGWTKKSEYRWVLSIYWKAPEQGAWYFVSQLERT